MLGEVMVAADINQNGHLDLVLGCPSASGTNRNTHAGRVYGVTSSTAHSPTTQPTDIAQAASLQLSG